jgi:DeoR family transcriptional regulator of aga operon
MLSNMKVSESVPAEVRRAQLERAVAERGFLRVTDAALELGVSSVTVRADLAVLEGEGRVQRVHGGAMPMATAGESSFEANVAHEAAAKRAIGRAAAGLVASGNSVLLDVGSTALAVANALVDRHDLSDVLVITNGLTIALALEVAMPRFTVVVTGGTLRPLQHSLVGPFAMLDVVWTDIAFIGCNGVDVEHGVTNINLPEAEVKRRMVASTKRAVVVADGSKLGIASLGRIGTLDEFDSLVTTGDASVLEGSQINLLVAS